MGILKSRCTGWRRKRERRERNICNFLLCLLFKTVIMQWCLSIHYYSVKRCQWTMFGTSATVLPCLLRRYTVHYLIQLTQKVFPLWFVCLHVVLFCWVWFVLFFFLMLAERERGVYYYTVTQPQMLNRLYQSYSPPQLLLASCSMNAINISGLLPSGMKLWFLHVLKVFPVCFF